MVEVRDFFAMSRLKGSSMTPRFWKRPPEFISILLKLKGIFTSDYSENSCDAEHYGTFVWGQFDYADHVWPPGRFVWKMFVYVFISIIV
jgi:hypothetical protein